MAQKSDDNQLTVIARSPFHIYYEGPASSVSATNKVGDFDILPGHADFFSVLEPGEIIIETGGEPVTFQASNGIVTAQSNEVMLFANM